MKFIVLLFAVFISIFSFPKRIVVLPFEETGDTITLHFETTEYPKDSILAQMYLRKINADSSEGVKYTQFNFFSEKSDAFRVLNLFGEYVGGSGVNPTAVSYFLYQNKITSTALPGEVIRIDQKSPNSFLVYCDEMSRLSSHVIMYQMTLTEDVVQLIRQPKPLRNFFFDCIQQKVEKSSELPKAIPTTNDENLLQVLGVLKDTLAPNTFYFNDDQLFLSRSFVYDSLQFMDGLIYYRHSNGDQLEKFVRINNGKKIKDWMLALRADDPEVQVSGLFLNDSIFVRTRVSRKLEDEGIHQLRYSVDSTLIQYKYNATFDFSPIAQTTYKYTQTQWVHNNQVTLNIDAVDFPPFFLNGEKVQGFVEKVKDLETARTYFQYTLKQFSNQKVIIKLEMPDFQGAIFDVDYAVRTQFVDVNLDGYKDIQWYISSSSGSAGMYYDVYLYLPNLKAFSVKPSEFSGYNLEVDSKLRTVTSFGKSGYYNFEIQIIHLNTLSKISFFEIYRCEEIGRGKLKLQHKKHNNKKILYQKTKVILIENYEDRQEIENVLYRL